MVKTIGKQNKDFMLIIAAVLLLILSGAIIWSVGFKNKNNPNVSQILLPKVIGRADFTIDFGNGGKRVFEGDIIGNETPINVLSQAAQAGNFSYKLNGNGNLVSIGKSVNSGEKSWQWYINGIKINKQLNEIIIKANDRILIRYE